MDEIRQTQKKYCSRVLIFSIFISFACILAGQPAIGKGLLLGTLFSILNFILMGQSLPQLIGKTKKKTLVIAIGSIYFRYIVLAVPLVISIKYDNYNLFAVIPGLFSVQIAILANHLLKIIMRTDSG